ncbi:MAG: HDIG domain-containing metalloprotein [Ignavibacteriota bacterium]
MQFSTRGFSERLGKAIRTGGWRSSKSVRLVIAVALTLLLALLFPQAQSRQNVTGYSVGALWTSADVNAPFSFRLLKNNQQYHQEIAKALENFYPVFVIDSTAKRTSFDSLERVLARYSEIAALPKEEYLRTSDTLDRLNSLLNLSGEESSALVSYLAAQTKGTTGKTASVPVAVILEDEIAKLLASSYYVASIPSVYTTSEDQKIAIRKRASEEQIIAAHDLLTKDGVLNKTLPLVANRFHGSESLKSALAKIATATLIPNLRYSAEESDESKKGLVERVPKTDGVVLEGQNIISKGEVITPAAKASLESLAQARIDLGGQGAIAARALGTTGHVAIIVLLFVLYVKFIRRRIYKDNAQLLLISVILIFPALMAYISVGIRTQFPLEYLILIPVTSMLLTVLFDSRTGFYGTVIVALLVAGIRGNDYNVALAGLSAGAFAAYTVRDIRSRSQLFKSIGYIFLGYFVAITALAFERGAPLKDIGFELAAAAGNALISPVLTLGLVFVIERIFDTMSDLRLADLNDINHPLLRKLSLEAPGTYHHTMLVAQLAENAALAIGANSLLAKIGAMFHDVGKIASPDDFIENQNHSNIHDTLSSSESAARIRAHVTRGVILAQQEKLPEKIVDFIPMHHGTLRISFFYQKALGLLAAGGTLDESAFRYPGPKPNTKETAIVMLADASEAVARTVATHNDEPTVELIEHELASLFRERIADGQLDDCDLTIHDLVIIRSVFARLLIGSMHSRIAYPQPQQTIPNERAQAKLA